ncbi:MAG: sugar phosphate isomerase/epimerase [Bryobacterales bacterium]
MKPKLGLDFFSLRSQGWSAFELLDFAAKNGAQVGHFSEPRFLGSLDEAHLRKVRAHADKLGLAIEVGFGSICPTSTRFAKDDGTAPEQLRRMLAVAKALRSPIVRCYLGSSLDRGGATPLAQHVDNTIASCKAVRDDFLRAGVKIAVENHAGDLQALELRDLVERAGTDYVGALLDSGNAAWTLEDPHHTMEVLAPIAVTTGVRDSRIWMEGDGVAVMWVPLGEGNVDIARWQRRLAELRPDLPFSLEIINVPRPRMFDVRKTQFWDEYHDVPAWVYAQFLALAESGKPYQAPGPPAGVESGSDAAKAWAKEQERRDVERDLAYCRNQLGLGA